MKRNSITAKWYDQHIFIGSQRWSVSPLLQNFLKRITRNEELPFLHATTDGNIGGKYRLIFLKARETYKAFSMERETICYYTVAGSEWTEVVTICKPALTLSFGRIPQSLFITAHEFEA